MSPALPIMDSVFLAIDVFLCASVYVLLGLMWTSFITSMSARESMLVASASFLLSFFFQIIISTQETLSLFSSALIPVLSATCWHFARSQRHSAGIIMKAEKTQTHKPPAIVILMVIFLIAGSVIRGVFSDTVITTLLISGTLIQDWSSIAFSILLFFVCYFVPAATKTYRVLWTVLTVLFFASLFSMTLFSSDDYLSGQKFVVMGMTCIRLLLVMILADSARARNASPIVVFGFYLVLVDIVSSFLGYVVVPYYVQMSGITLENWSMYFSLGFALMLIAATTVFLGSRPFADEPIDIALAKQALNSQEAKDTDFKMLCKEKGLTARETETALLLAQGHSQRKISQITYVAIGTTQTHIKNVYLKFGIHSKQELIDLANKQSTS
jgi:DNA-binding CsgD family transcriptional regulator